jgi:hypothetical protein
MNIGNYNIIKSQSTKLSSTLEFDPIDKVMEKDITFTTKKPSWDFFEMIL